jgi:arginine decarboxylase
VDQNKTPLYTKLLEHASKQPIQFHIPGHKKGRGMAPEFREFIGENALSIDLINIAPLDDLHQPMHVIRESLDLAAQAFGADYTYFSVQGTSGSIMAMIMSVVGPGDKIIVPRNIHKSVMSAIIFAGAKPIFIHPAMDERLGVAHGITTKAVRTALERHPDAKALMVINPTYFGVSAHLKEIVDVSHEYGVPVLVDEAHGVHIHFHDDLPLSAMQAGADMAATSVHKLGGSMTQTSILNVKKGLVNPDRIQTVISMLTTTSTSYILLASLDVARRHLYKNGKFLAEYSIELAEYARRELNKVKGVYCVGSEILDNEAAYDYDPTKLIIHVSALGLTGSQIEKWLREHHNLEVELSDMYNILCIVTPGDTRETIEALVSAFRELSQKQMNQPAIPKVVIRLPEIPLLALSPRDAFYAETEVVPLKEAIGRIIAEFIYIYPPGIPILLPGEVISEENIAYIDEHLKVGLPVQGPEDKNIEKVRVIIETAPIV